MLYSHVLVYDPEGNFLGYSIKGDEALKLQTTNLYREEELDQLAGQIIRLNENTQVRDSWPDARDPDVLALTEDPAWLPIEMIFQEVVDEERSYIVYKSPENAGEMDAGEIDQEASVFAYKLIMAPARPSDAGLRIRQAQETVARQRSGNLVS